MPRKRNPENKPLPKRWQKKHGAYYYRVPKGQEHLWDGKQVFRLGKGLPEAYREYASRVEISQNMRTISDLLDRYELEVVPNKAPKTQKDNHAYIRKLRAVMGNVSVTTPPEPQHIYQYYRKSKAKRLAKLEIALLSHLFTKAVEWGEISRHPFKGELRLPGDNVSERFVEDWEIEECFKLPKNFLHPYIVVKILTGLRKTDLLKMKVSDIQDDGIYVATSKSKGKKKLIFSWTQALREAIDQALSARPVDISPYLFCTRSGASYLKDDGTTSGFDSAWQRFMKKALLETELKEKFKEHDLRGKTGSDSESDEAAMELLGHSNINTTRKHYRRKAKIVTPLR